MQTKKDQNNFPSPELSKEANIGVWKCELINSLIVVIHNDICLHNSSNLSYAFNHMMDLRMFGSKILNTNWAVRKSLTRQYNFACIHHSIWMSLEMIRKARVPPGITWMLHIFLFQMNRNMHAKINCEIFSECEKIQVQV